MWDVGGPNLVGSVIVLKGDVSGALHVAGVKARWWEIEHGGLLNRLGGCQEVGRWRKANLSFFDTQWEEMGEWWVCVAEIFTGKSYLE